MRILKRRIFNFFFIFIFAAIHLFSIKFAIANDRFLEKSYSDAELIFFVDKVRGKQFFSGKAIGCLRQNGQKRPNKCHASEQIEAWISCSDNAPDGSMISKAEIYMKGYTVTYVFDGRSFDGFVSEIAYSIATDFCDTSIEGDEECDGC